MRGKPNGHARFVEIHKDEVEKFIKSGVMRGYVDEERQAERLVLKYASELIGPYKITAKLVAKYYPSSMVTRAMRRLEEKGELDFKKNRAELLAAKLGEDASYDEKMKLLYKYGYLR